MDDSFISFKSSTSDELKLNQLEQLVHKTEEEDWEYIAKHPEIRTIIRLFLRRVFERRPTDIRAFAAEFSQLLKSELRNEEMGIPNEEKDGIS